MANDNNDDGLSTREIAYYGNGGDSGYLAKKRAMSNRDFIIQRLMQQGNQPEGKMVGGRYVPTSSLQNLNSMLSMALAGKKLQENVEAQNELDTPIRNTVSPSRDNGTDAFMQKMTEGNQPDFQYQPPNRVMQGQMQQQGQMQDPSGQLGMGGNPANFTGGVNSDRAYAQNRPQQGGIPNPLGLNKLYVYSAMAKDMPAYLKEAQHQQNLLDAGMTKENAIKYALGTKPVPTPNADETLDIVNGDYVIRNANGKIVSAREREIAKMGYTPTTILDKNGQKVYGTELDKLNPSRMGDLAELPSLVDTVSDDGSTVKRTMPDVVRDASSQGGIKTGLSQEEDQDLRQIGETRKNIINKYANVGKELSLMENLERTINDPKMKDKLILGGKADAKLKFVDWLNAAGLAGDTKTANDIVNKYISILQGQGGGDTNMEIEIQKKSNPNYLMTMDAFKEALHTVKMNKQMEKGIAQFVQGKSQNPRQFLQDLTTIQNLGVAPHKLMDLIRSGDKAEAAKEMKRMFPNNVKEGADLLWRMQQNGAFN